MVTVEEECRNIHTTQFREGCREECDPTGSPFTGCVRCTCFDATCDKDRVLAGLKKGWMSN